MGRRALIVLLLAACPQPTPEDDPELPTSAEWSDGTVQLVVASAELESGAQGGFHVRVEYRVAMREQRDATFMLRVWRASDRRVVSRNQRTDDISGELWRSGDVTVFMCPSPVGVSVVDEELSFELVVTDRNDHVLGIATTRSTLTCPASEKNFCESICKG